MTKESEDISENFIFNGRNPCLSLKNDTMIVDNMLNKLTEKYSKMSFWELKSYHEKDTLSDEEGMFLNEYISSIGGRDERPEEDSWKWFTKTIDSTQFRDRFHDALQDRRIIFEQLEELSIAKPDTVENWFEIFDMMVNYPRIILKYFPLEYQDIFGEKIGMVIFSFFRPEYLEGYKSKIEKRSLDSNLDNFEYPDERDDGDNCDALTKFEERCKNKKTIGLYCQIHQDYHESEGESVDKNDEYDHNSSRWGLL